MSDWQSDKQAIEQTLRLYERELDSIAEQISSICTNNAQAEQERAEAEALKMGCQAALDRAGAFAADFESKLRALGPKLPSPLQEIVRPLFNRMPERQRPEPTRGVVQEHRMPPDANTRVAVGERIQTIVGVLNEIDKFNNAVSVFNEKQRNPNGEEMAVETVYIGLAAAYFVNEAADFAGTGAPGPSGWDWTPRPEIAADVRNVLRIYRNERPPQFVVLPASIR